MKKLTLTFFIMLFAFQGHSQCFIDPYIQANYEVDAKVLVLRDILSDPSDPDYDNPFIPTDRTIPYLEKLSAIYENPNNSATIDSLFNEFKVHVNTEYGDPPAPFNEIIFSVDNNIPWIEDFKNTGISGIAALDDLMITYQFSVDSFFVHQGAGKTYFTIITSFDFLNVSALIDDFEAISDINSVYASGNLNRFNYTGIPYYIMNEPVEACDIDVDGEVYSFTLYSGDCMAMCAYSKTWTVHVTEDCEVLSTLENEISDVSIYPNPTSDILYLQDLNAEIKTVEIYSIQGKLVRTFSQNVSEINVSQLNLGIYFLKIMTSDGRKTIQRFIKK